MLSTRGNRLAVALSCLALFFSLVGNTTIWVISVVERGRIEKFAQATNDGLICLLERAKVSVQSRTDLDTNQKQEIYKYYNREIRLLGGPIDCNSLTDTRN